MRLPLPDSAATDDEPAKEAALPAARHRISNPELPSCSRRLRLLRAPGALGCPSAWYLWLVTGASHAPASRVLKEHVDASSKFMGALRLDQLVR
jgi:hypothetical protein